MAHFIRPITKNLVGVGHATRFQITLSSGQSRSVHIPKRARKAVIGASGTLGYFFGNPPTGGITPFSLPAGNTEIEVGEDQVLSFINNGTGTVRAYIEFYGGDDHVVRCKRTSEHLHPTSGVVECILPDHRDSDTTETVTFRHTLRPPSHTVVLRSNTSEYEGNPYSRITSFRIENRIPFRYTLDNTDPYDSTQNVTLATGAVSTVNVSTDATRIVIETTTELLYTLDGTDPREDSDRSNSHGTYITPTSDHTQFIIEVNNVSELRMRETGGQANIVVRQYNGILVNPGGVTIPVSPSQPGIRLYEAASTYNAADATVTITFRENYALIIPTDTKSIQVNSQVAFEYAGRVDIADVPGTTLNQGLHYIPLGNSDSITFYNSFGQAGNIDVRFIRGTSDGSTHIFITGGTAPFAFTTDGSDPGAGRGIYVEANQDIVIPCKNGSVKVINASVPSRNNQFQWQRFNDPSFGGNVYEQNTWVPLGGEYKDDFNTNVHSFSVPGNAKWAWIGARIPFEFPNPPPAPNTPTAKFTTNGLDPQGSTAGHDGFLLLNNQSIKIPVPAATNQLKVLGIDANAAVTILYFGMG